MRPGKNILSARSAALLLFCLVFSAPSSSAQQASAKYNEAVARIRSGDLAGGCASAEEMARKDPSFYAAYNLLGLCATQKGEAEKAQSFFRKSIKLNPKFVDAYNNLAVNLLQQGALQAAMAHFSMVLRLAPNNLTALYNIGKIELISGSVPEAVKHLRQANGLAPEDEQISLALAEALLATKENGPALDLIKQLIERKQNSGALIPAALLALEGGEEGLAHAALEKAVRLDPAGRQAIFNFARAASNRQKYQLVRVLLNTIAPLGKDSAEWNVLQGYADYKLGNPSKALERLRRAIELDPLVEDYYLKIGELMLFHRSDEAAAAFFEAGLKRLPDSALLHFGLAVSLMSANRNAPAMHEHLEMALRLEPDFQSALSVLCLLSQRDQDWARLQDAAERLIHLNGESPEGYYFKAAALMGRPVGQKQPGVFEEAKRLLQKSIRLDPNSTKSRLALGKVLIEAGQVAPAIIEFERVAALSPDNAEAYFHLARLYRKAGQPEKSLQASNRFKELEAKSQEQGAVGWKVLFQVAN